MPKKIQHWLLSRSDDLRRHTQEPFIAGAKIDHERVNSATISMGIAKGYIFRDDTTYTLTKMGSIMVQRAAAIKLRNLATGAFKRSVTIGKLKKAKSAADAAVEHEKILENDFRGVHTEWKSRQRASVLERDDLIARVVDYPDKSHRGPLKLDPVNVTLSEWLNTQVIASSKLSRHCFTVLFDALLRGETYRFTDDGDGFTSLDQGVKARDYFSAWKLYAAGLVDAKLHDAHMGDSGMEVAIHMVANDHGATALANPNLRWEPVSRDGAVEKV